MSCKHITWTRLAFATQLAAWIWCSSISYSTAEGVASPECQGILETQNFKGEALVVYHVSKFTGTHDTGARTLAAPAYRIAR